MKISILSGNPSNFDQSEIGILVKGKEIFVEDSDYTQLTIGTPNWHRCICQ